MSWVRLGDTSATYPPLLRIAADASADDRLVNEVAGFVFRAACLSGAHLTDYVLDLGTLYMLGGGRTSVLLEVCRRAGLLQEVDGVGFKLVADPEFVHIRLKQEIEWERQQRKDTRDPGLLVPVRYRDGDNCRWCGIQVEWLGRKTARSAELDHLNPGEAGTTDTMVVACRACNRQRSGNRESWDDTHKLLPVPSAPNYGACTAKFLSQNGFAIQQNTPSDEQVEKSVDPGQPSRLASAGSVLVEHVELTGQASHLPGEDPAIAKVIHDVTVDPGQPSRLAPAGPAQVNHNATSDGLSDAVAVSDSAPDKTIMQDEQFNLAVASAGPDTSVDPGHRPVKTMPAGGLDPPGIKPPFRPLESEKDPESLLMRSVKTSFVGSGRGKTSLKALEPTLSKRRKKR